jgi:hypothetical protein
MRRSSDCDSPVASHNLGYKLIFVKPGRVLASFSVPFRSKAKTARSPLKSASPVRLSDGFKAGFAFLAGQMGLRSRTGPLHETANRNGGSEAFAAKYARARNPRNDVAGGSR